jgi:hypothetical protein
MNTKQYYAYDRLSLTIAHLAVAVACVDWLVHIDHAGVLVPAKGVVKQRHVVGKAVGAVLCMKHQQ